MNNILEQKIKTIISEEISKILYESNVSLQNAKNKKDNEYYTNIIDIENELSLYSEVFNGKIVYCNCDDYNKSNFYKYFYENFHNLNLKLLITTGFVENGNGIGMKYDGKHKNMFKMHGDGSFDSQESILYLKECDIVVSNPPFSRFNDYFNLLINNNKKFIIIGNINAVNYKKIIPYVINNKLHIGNSEINNFIRPDGSNIQLRNTVWYHNTDIDKHKILKLSGVFKKTIDDNKKYDNYNAINFDRINNIPCDYYGNIGVPLTIVKCIDNKGILYINYNNEIIKFKIVDILSHPKIEGKEKYTRIIIKRVN